MPTVRILPRNVEVAVGLGESLLDALHRGGVAFQAECGAQGTCGRCVAQILSGQCEWPGSELLAAEKRKEGFVLACQAQVTGDLVVEIPETLKDSNPAGTNRYPVPEVERVATSELIPLSQKVALELAPVSAGENASDLDRLAGCFTGAGEVCYSLSVLRSLPDAVRQSQGRITVTLAEEGTRKHLLKLEPGVQTARHFGVACDVGTTTVALQIVDLNTGRVIDTVGDYNGQIECGADVISRILYAQKPGRLEELRLRVIRTVNGLLDATQLRHGISAEEITCAVFSGNTTMTHLLLGINPRHIREEPYVPALKTAPVLSAGELELHLWPEALVLFTPAVGSYVGGDITAGVLCTQLHRAGHGITLFIDIGTNGELVLSGEDWMVSCACSAGPAFEGVGISCGMRAAAGAIETVDITPDGEVVFQVIGGGMPRGICGSGLIELIAGLFTHEVIGRDGRFNEANANNRVRLEEHPRAFVLAEAGQTSTGKAISLSERDIANLMRAKAAIYSACGLFLKKVGLTCAEIDRVYIAGGFGCHLDIQKAITIGLFPDLEPGRFEYLGNTSLQGAYLALLSKAHRLRLADIAKRMTYVDLSSETDYTHEYTGALFLPHTDASLFPRVMKSRRDRNLA
jgi:uncharacterized 2Fe-2S/4Fe-4S cluster protein (DUF4445 family)